MDREIERETYRETDREIERERGKCIESEMSLDA
jgi:hypothetical protein